MQWQLTKRYWDSHYSGPHLLQCHERERVPTPFFGPVFCTGSKLTQTDAHQSHMRWLLSHFAYSLGTRLSRVSTHGELPLTISVMMFRTPRTQADRSWLLPSFNFPWIFLFSAICLIWTHTTMEHIVHHCPLQSVNHFPTKVFKCLP